MSGLDLAQGIAFQRSADPAWQLTMIAIGFAESSGEPRALGDYIGQPGLILPDDATEHCFEANGQYGAQCYTSIGLWQINMAWNWGLVSLMALSSDPVGVAEWLEIPENNGAVAERIYETQGFAAWSTYTSGAYLMYQGPAQDAFNAYPGTVAGHTPSPALNANNGNIGGAALNLGLQASGLLGADDWSGSVRVSGQSVQNMAANAVGYSQAFRALAQGG